MKCYSHTLLLNSPAKYLIELTLFLNCNAQNTAGAINCEVDSAQLIISSSNFYQCVTKATGSSIYTKSPLKIICANINSCQAYISAGFFASGSIQGELVSISNCEGYHSTIRLFGTKCVLTTSNVSCCQVDFQVAGLITYCTEDVNVSFLTFCHNYDKDACTITFYYTPILNAAYFNVFNSTSDKSSTDRSVFVFGYGTRDKISNSIIQHYSQKYIISYYESNNKELVTFINCTFDSTCQHTLDRCQSISVTYLNNPTFIIPPTLYHVQCKISYEYPEKKMNLLLSFITLIIFSNRRSGIKSSFLDFC